MPLPPGLAAYQAAEKKKKGLMGAGAKQGPAAGHVDFAAAASAKLGQATGADLPEIKSAKKNMPIRKGKKKVTATPPWLSSGVGSNATATGLPAFANAAAAKMTKK